MSLLSAAQSGDRGEALRALRDRLAAEIDACASARDVAALSARLVDVLAQLESVTPVEKKGTPLDELARRREGRSAS